MCINYWKGHYNARYLDLGYYVEDDLINLWGKLCLILDLKMYTRKL